MQRIKTPIVDAEICSPFARPDLYTNVYVINNEDVNFFLLRRSLQSLKFELSFFLSLSLRSQKWIRDVGGFTGVNPPMPKLAQGVYGKTVQPRFNLVLRIDSLFIWRMVQIQFGRVFPSLNFSVSFFMDFFPFYSRCPLFRLPFILPLSRVVGASHGAPTATLWANVGHCVSFNGSGHSATIVIS